MRSLFKKFGPDSFEFVQSRLDFSLLCFSHNKTHEMDSNGRSSEKGNYEVQRYDVKDDVTNDVTRILRCF